MSSVEKARAQRSALIQDLKEVAKRYEGQQVTRDLYRGQGTYSERVWHKHFSRFKDFVSAAGIEETTNQPDQPETQAFKEQGNTWEITLPKTHIDSVDALLAYYKVDKSLWAVEEFTINTWQMAAKNNYGNVVVTPLYQVKAKLKKRKEVAALFSEIAKMKEEAKTWAPLPSPIARLPLTRTGNMLEINIPDLHIGKLAWAQETGYQNYDTAIATELFYEALEGLIRRTSHLQFEQVVFVVGNDLLQADNQESETYNGTRVDTDSRYKKTFTKARIVIATAIERLRQIAPVKAVIVEGNHDRASMFFLGEILEAQFSKYDDVEVDNSPKSRKYHQFGANLLMFTHGDKGKRQDFPLLMAAEEPTLWGLSRYREVHTGHLHQTKTEEFHGVRVRILPALCAPDAWHSAAAFTNHLRVAEAYVWNKEEGLVAQAFYGAD